LQQEQAREQQEQAREREQAAVPEEERARELEQAREPEQAAGAAQLHHSGKATRSTADRALRTFANQF